MILDLRFDEIDLLIETIGMVVPHATRVEDLQALANLHARLESICSQSFEPVATAWERAIQNEKGKPKFWYRMVEVRVFSEVLYVFRVRAEDLLENVDPTRSHSVMLGKQEYRSTDPAPAEIQSKALAAFEGVRAWMVSLGFNADTIRRPWPPTLPELRRLLETMTPGQSVRVLGHSIFCLREVGRNWCEYVIDDGPIADLDWTLQTLLGGEGDKP